MKGIAKAEKRGERAAAEGTVQSYIHPNGKIGVLVEVDCETDFVARNDDFAASRATSRCTIAGDGARSPSTRTACPPRSVEREMRIAEEQVADKPENIRPKIVEGKLDAWLKEVVLLKQAHVNGEKHDGQTIEEIRAAIAAKTGENIVIRRFTRFRSART